ncbi:hypothetical protein F511_47743 [Dorcoceras hygrometricum]|uniref:Uncharacterized protein n=1 Tax=Dorcoceras hygrometricum TaxID=472368 RepID=A0A2Z6ZQC3_9LAMI|nr:hypothetical protein F511_47743 [Dorcoceras hygrometricum]
MLRRSLRRPTLDVAAVEARWAARLSLAGRRDDLAAAHHGLLQRLAFVRYVSHVDAR